MEEMCPLLAMKTVTGGDQNWRQGKWAQLLPRGREEDGDQGVQASQEGTCAAISPPFGSCFLRVGLLSLPLPFSFPGESLSLGGGLRGDLLQLAAQCNPCLYKGAYPAPAGLEPL